MTMEVKVNINVNASVRLTKKGAKIINDYYADLHKDYPLIAAKNYKEGDVLVDQIYNIMYMFGSGLYCGADPLFIDNEIVIHTEIN